MTRVEATITRLEASMTRVSGELDSTFEQVAIFEGHKAAEKSVSQL